MKLYRKKKARKVGWKANLTDGNTISAIPLSASLRGVQKEKEYKNMSWKLPSFISGCLPGHDFNPLTATWYFV